MGIPASWNRKSPAIALAIVTLLAGCGGKEAGAPKGDNTSRQGGPGEEISVAAAPALRTPIPRKIEFVGSLAGVEQVTLSSEVEGTVEKVHADLGDPVRKGQTLASLVQDEFVFRRDQARAETAQIAAKLG
ncbi:MAG: efflux system, rane fusion protein CmeA, partial [Deltaproteobacteria bacterium]|nr:efflux system, rane fusion protein CmeA [Deltaproteobacteria bacterium]